MEKPRNVHTMSPLLRLLEVSIWEHDWVAGAERCKSVCHLSMATLMTLKRCLWSSLSVRLERSSSNAKAEHLNGPMSGPEKFNAIQDLTRCDDCEVEKISSLARQTDVNANVWL